MSKKVFYDAQSRDLMIIHENGDKNGKAGPGAELLFFNLLANPDCTIFLTKPRKSTSNEAR